MYMFGRVELNDNTNTAFPMHKITHMYVETLTLILYICIIHYTYHLHNIRTVHIYGCYKLYTQTLVHQ